MASPQQVYQDLLGQGASTTEAIGIMANMINESGFNAEAVGDQGTSFGVVQEHGNYGYLVTGNVTQDLLHQISLLKTQGGFGDASGTTGGQAAGNFAASFERCVGCQPGGQQYNSRVANANTVEGWIQSGKWPTSAGSAVPAQAQTTGIISSIAGDLLGGVLNSLGLGSLKDLFERLGLILLGAALILLGIHLLASGGSKQPFNINVAETPESKTRTVKAGPVKHSKTTKAVAGTGAKEAVEAAAVALWQRGETITGHISSFWLARCSAYRS